MSSSETFDFIIVGAGPSGAALSTRLAASLPSQRILLLEAGDNGDGKDTLLYDRFTSFKTLGANYNYQTVPQEALNNRLIDYSRGKGLGGSSLINFALWNRGPRDDYDEWARMVGDERFAWENVKKVYDGIENFKDPGYTDERRDYVSIDEEAHGQNGPVHVEYPRQWEDFLPGVMKGAEEVGWKVNKDINSGDPIGVGICPSTAKRGVRVTARSAYLSRLPDNLTVRAGVQVARVLFEEKRAVGVKSVEGVETFVSREVILCAGALDAPKLLLLSGVGSRQDLDHLGIPVVHDLPGVGQNLQDHCHAPMVAIIKEGSRLPNALRPGSTALAEAREKFAKDSSGPLASVNGACVVGYLKETSIYESAEFKSLDVRTQAHLQKATVPLWELTAGVPAIRAQQTSPKQYMASVGVVMNPQSRGVVRLQSADAREPALFDPRHMSHPYDQKVLVTAAKAVLAWFKSPVISATIEGPYALPASESDEDVLAFLKANMHSTWHMSGTCKMGIEGDAVAVVDSQFLVKGVEGLRVADLSVLPFLVNAHPVAVAYLVGELAAGVVGKQYGR